MSGNIVVLHCSVTRLSCCAYNASIGCFSAEVLVTKHFIPAAFGVLLFCVLVITKGTFFFVFALWNPCLDQVALDIFWSASSQKALSFPPTCSGLLPVPLLGNLEVSNNATRAICFRVQHRIMELSIHTTRVQYSKALQRAGNTVLPWIAI